MLTFAVINCAWNLLSKIKNSLPKIRNYGNSTLVAELRMLASENSQGALTYQQYSGVIFIFYARYQNWFSSQYNLR